MRRRETGTTVRVMTWNIHGGIGPDGRRDLSRIVELVRAHSPDIAALQEIDSRNAPAGIPAFDLLAAALGPHTMEARLVSGPEGDYGHAVISRWPIGRARQHDVSVRDREPRAVLDVSVDTPSGPLQVIAVHLGLASLERRHQAAVLGEVARRAEGPAIVLGDFNDWVPGGAVNRVLSGAMPRRTRHRTFPAWWPVLDLDRIYCRPGEMLLRSWTDPRGRGASDHLPIIADLRLP